MIRLGLIGAGRWGKAYLRTLRALGGPCRLTHVCTSQPRHTLGLPDEVVVVQDWKDLMRAGPEAVIIATPPRTHAEILEACLDAGKPALVEKPLCLDVETAERLHQRIASSGVPVLVDHTHLFHPAYETLKRAVAESGEPIQLVVSEGMGFGPFRTHTSALWDWGPHDVSLCLDLLAQIPQHVDALGVPLEMEGAPEQVSIRLEFPGGACAWIEVGRLSLVKRRSFAVFTEQRLYVWDETAADKLTVTPLRVARRYEQGVPEPLARKSLPIPSASMPLANVVTYFVQGLSGGDRRRFGTGLAVDVVRVLAACEDALQAKAKIR